MLPFSDKLTSDLIYSIDSHSHVTMATVHDKVFK